MDKIIAIIVYVLFVLGSAMVLFICWNFVLCELCRFSQISYWQSVFVVVTANTVLFGFNLIRK